MNTAASIQIALLGNIDVGKTSLIMKHIHPDRPLKIEKIKTHGTDIKTKYVSIFDDTISKVKIWDTAGQEEHADIIGSYVKRLDACLMAFDLSNRESFKMIFKWIKQLNQQCDIPYVVVGNKCDLPQERQVSQEDLEEIGRLQNVHIFETSAKTGHSVDNAFHCLLYQVIKPCLAVREQLKFDSKLGDSRL